MISNEICDFKFKWDEIWYLMKSNEICEFEPVVSNENEICDTIWNEIKSNEICDFKSAKNNFQTNFITAS